MNEPISREQAEALADFITTIRTDWNARGIVKALSDAREKAGAAELARAAIKAAATPTNRTPAVIPLPGAHWLSTTADATDAQGRILREEVDQARAAVARKRQENLSEHKAGDHHGAPTPECELCAPHYAEVSA